jgi:hypothetical protein
VNLPGLTFADLDDLTAAIIPTARADHVRSLHLTAVVAGNQRERLKLVVLAAAATAAL